VPFITTVHRPESEGLGILDNDIPGFGSSTVAVRSAREQLAMATSFSVNCLKTKAFDATPAVKPDERNTLVVKVSNRAINELGTGGITGPAMICAPAANSKAGRARP